MLFFLFFSRKGNPTPRQYKAETVLTILANLHIIHKAGTNLTVSDMLSRGCSQITKQLCQLQHKTVPPHIEFIQLKTNNSLKRIHYLFKHEDVEISN